MLECHLRMAVGSLQKTGVAVTCQLCHCLFIHTAVEQGGDKIVAQSVEVKPLGEAVFIKELTKMLGEGIRMNRLSILSGKEILAERDRVPEEYLPQVSVS